MKYFTSDLHFNHKKIIDFCPNRVQQLGIEEKIYADYRTMRSIYYKNRKETRCPVINDNFEIVRNRLIEEHNKKLVEVINKHVRKRDQLYILGDFGFGNTRELKKWLYKLNGRKTLILGNHDRNPRVMLSLGFHDVFENEYLKLGPDKIKVYMSHFPFFPTWKYRLKYWIYYRKQPDKRYLHKRIYDTGQVLLHGHTHDEFVVSRHNPRQIHVGIDAWGKPASENEILKVIKNPEKY